VNPVSVTVRTFVSADVRGLFSELGVRLPERSGLNVAVRCFANGGAHKRSDRDASASVNVETGAWFCHGCGAKGGAYDAALALGRTPGEAMVLLERYSFTTPGTSRQSSPAKNFGLRATEADVDRFRRCLLDNGAALERLKELRGWHPAAIERLEVGYDGRRVTFPYRNADGQLVGMGRYQPNPDRRADEPKLKADAGSRRELFPAPERLKTDGWLWLLEGEPDAVRAASLALPAVAVPGVEGWRREYIERFRGRRVVVCFDCDRPGRSAAQRVACELLGLAADVRWLDLDLREESGFDFSDWTAPARSAAERIAIRRILLEAAELAPRRTR
jgi:hypothetical protein